MQISLGDWIAGIGAVCAVSTLAFSEWRKRRQDHAARDRAEEVRTKLAVDRAAAEARADAEASAREKADQLQVRSLQDTFTRMANAQEKLLAAFILHDKEDTRFHAELETHVATIAADQAKQARDVDQLRAQLSRMMPPSDTFTEVLASTARRKAAGAAD